MTPDPVVCPVDATLQEVAQKMEHWHVRRLLVMENEQAVGVIALGDLAEHLGEKAHDVLVEVSRSPKTLNKGQSS